MVLWTSMRLHARGCSSSLSPSSHLIPWACRKEGVGTLRHRISRSDGASSSWASRFCATAVGRVETRRERAPSVRVSYSTKIDGLRVPKAAAKVINHGGDQRTTRGAAGHKRREGPHRWPCEGQARHKKPHGGLSPRVIRQVIAVGGADGGAQFAHQRKRAGHDPGGHH